MGHMIPKLALVIPCYNEEEIIEDSYQKISQFIQTLKQKSIIDKNSVIVMVDDGSGDNTWEIINEFGETNNDIIGVKLSKNFGHQNALLAGLESIYKECDCTITIDADLQDDITVIEEMVIKFTKGNHIVYGVRKERKTDKVIKRQTALLFYKIMKWLGVDIVYNHADYRLASKRVIAHLFDFNEVNLFLRGMFPLIGFKHSNVYYDRLERTAGKSKYPFRKMLAFAVEGITSFSIKPLRIVAILGLFIFIVSLFLGLYSLYSYFLYKTVPGWTSIALPLYFLSGVQLLSIGVVGEYLGKIYKETKQRPRFIIEKVEKFN